MFRRVMAWVGRIAVGILGFGLAVLLVTVPVGILGSSNLVWGEDNQYGRVDVPGTAVLKLPAGSMQVSVAVDLVGRGNGTPDLPLPSDLALTVAPVDGAGQPVVTRVHGASSSNANDNRVNTQIEAWTVDVPKAGSYRVTTKGDFDGIGLNPQLWFGHGPPIPGTMVPVVAAGIVVVLVIVWFLLMPLIRRRRRRPSASAQPAEPAIARSAGSVNARTAGSSDWQPQPRGVAEAGDEGPRPRAGGAQREAHVAADPLDQLSKLADLRDRGALTDAEFNAEKAKILGQ